MPPRRRVDEPPSRRVAEPPRRKDNDGEGSSSNVVDEFGRLFQEQARVHGDQTQQLLQLQTQGESQGRVTIREQERSNPYTEGTYDRFQQMNPPDFDVSGDPTVALNWVKALEAIFEYLHFIDVDRVSCAIFLLTKAKHTWWEETKVTLTVATMTWEEFKTLFYDKYFPADVKARKVANFLELKQGGLTVSEYIRKLEEDCQFVPYIAANDVERANHLLRVLQAEIKRDVRMSKATSYKKVVQKALMSEQDEKEIERKRQ